MKASKLKNYLVAKKVYFKGKRYVDYLKYRVVFLLVLVRMYTLN